MYGNHFKFQELVVTSSGLDNTISSAAHLGNLANLWDYLNFLREKFGKPIYINSAFRTPSVNKHVGGSNRSLHLQGRAADIRPKDLQDLEQLWNVVCSYNKEYGCLSEKIKYFLCMEFSPINNKHLSEWKGAFVL